MVNKFRFLSIAVLSIFVFSCDDISNISDQINQMKDVQTQLLKQQTQILQKLAALDKKVGSNSASNKPKPNNNKRKTPDPNFAHKIDIGGSVVLGNPDAAVTVTKFTDFQ